MLNLLSLILLVTLSAHAEEPPPIEANTIPVEYVRRSKSKKIYLFKSAEADKIKSGRILLIKTELEPIVAVRVLRTYEKDKTFAGKKIRDYEGFKDDLSPATAYIAIEKKGDYTPRPLNKDEKEDLKQLESSEDKPSASGDPPAFDKDLDAPRPAVTPSPQASVLPSASLDNKSSPPTIPEPTPEEEDSPADQIVLDEVTPIETTRHWFSGQFALLPNSAYVDTSLTPTTAPSSAPGTTTTTTSTSKYPGYSVGSTYFSGGGIRYGFSFYRMPFLHRSLLQDSFTAEASVFFYKILNFVPKATDAYSLMPVALTLRYNLFVGHNWIPFVYAGLLNNIVTSSTIPPDNDALILLSGFRIAAGVGMMFGVGPNWDIRVDAGLDMFAGGLVLRF